MRVVARFGSDFPESSGSNQCMLVCQKFSSNNGAECCLKGRKGGSRKNHFKV